MPRRTNRLRDWLQQTPPPMTKQAFAAEIGCTASYVSQLCRDTPPWPGRALQLRIARVTQYAVRPDHLAGLDDEEIFAPGDMTGPSAVAA